MKHQVLQAIGSSFTNQWIEERNDSKLKGFSTSAEQCLRDISSHKTILFFTTLFMVFGICILLTNSVLLGGIILILAISCEFLITRFDSPGKTTQGIAKDWRSLRRELIRQGVISKFSKLFENDFPDNGFVPQDDVRRFLVKSIDELMGSLSIDLIESQREGFPEKEGRIYRKMLQLKILTHDLGLEMNFDQYFE